ncbi:MAG: hypothetical protein HY078_10195 [Elusimicrobia bacterium]|nr:hypothetical protein [Elusimicrobiota bacterium]
MNIAVVVRCLVVAASVLPSAASAAALASSAGAGLHLERAIADASSAAKLEHAANPWEALVKKVLTRGTFQEADFYPAQYSLKDVQGDPKDSHSAEYVTIWGGVGDLGVFQGSWASFVSEDWPVKADGHWHIDQWIFRIAMDGEIIEATHIFMIQRKDRIIVDGSYKTLGQYKRTQPVSAEFRAEVQAKYEQLMRRWTAFQP